MKRRDKGLIRLLAKLGGALLVGGIMLHGIGAALQHATDRKPAKVPATNTGQQEGRASP